jgi:hypothetical protein
MVPQQAHLPKCEKPSRERGECTRGVQGAQTHPSKRKGMAYKQEETNRKMHLAAGAFTMRHARPSAHRLGLADEQRRGRGPAPP